ncbi:ATP-dependent RNA helicase DDX24-like isoform X1 [Stegodyphus dumicola]|uniref:ATP-dependent RNA helicase DDX24-like isoform X1 n=2 Tax=Stegodyphus dumicola TaxID=202533 RepID=UPI0015AEC531|nr:ATP-dependent RNA helicase DDX24-like isoform X1 [Stegodyphus dumicola]
MKSRKWKPVPVDASLMCSEEFQDFGGIEELDNYEIITKDTLRSTSKRKAKAEIKKIRKKQKVAHKEELFEYNEQNQNLDMSAWCNCYVPDPVLYALRDLGFHKPTEIQERVIPCAIRDHQDILGAAETGSGKTLAFGIPVVSGILSFKENAKNCEADSESHALHCLVLTPTRELAIQIKKHLQAICKYTNIKVASVVGGLAPEKQRRILKKSPDIIVATPGRLWEMMEEDESHLSHLSSVRYLVIDEADRMVEKGHFAELTQIIAIINGNKNNKKRQTFVFSATLTLVHDVPKRLVLKNKKGKLKKNKLDSLISVIGMKDGHKVIDITKKTAMVDTLVESQIMCSTEEKDLYLYYFLLMYPGRTLIFCNSIDSVRRLRTVLEYLDCNPYPLHSSMHQRQRLKNLERFAASSTAVLLATDVAARGLDIKGIEHVIHFQVPRTAETYVHRSGRTARAQSEGLSLMLIEPQDAVYYKRICKTLNKDKALPQFPVDHSILKAVRDRITLVHAIDKLEHRMKRLTAQNRWFMNAAKEMDIDIDEENLLNDLGDERECAAKCRQIKGMKKQLKLLLSKSIIPKMFTGSYPTKTGKLISLPNFGSEKAVKALENKQKQLKMKKIFKS